MVRLSEPLNTLQLMGFHPGQRKQALAGLARIKTLDYEGQPIPTGINPLRIMGHLCAAASICMTMRSRAVHPLRARAET